MADPSANVFDISEYFQSNGSNYEALNHVPVQDNRQDLTTPAAVDGNGPREGYQFSTVATVDPSFDGSGSDWSQMESSRPISTPLATNVQPSAVATFRGPTNFILPNAGHGGEFYVGDGCVNSGIECYQQRHHVEASLDPSAGYMNMVPGKGILDFHRFPTAVPTVTRSPLNLSSISPPQYQSTPIAYFQQHNSIVDSVPVHQMSAWPNFPSATPGQVYHYRTHYQPLPQRMVEQPPNEYPFGRCRPPIGAYYGTNRHPTLQHLLSNAPGNFNQPSIPTENQIVARGKVAPIKATASPRLNCYVCKRSYQNDVSYHNHWLRVHVLQDVDGGKKRKRDKLLDDEIYEQSITTSKQPRVEDGTRFNPGIAHSAAVSEFGEAPFSATAHNQQQLANISLHGSVGIDLHETDLPLDLSLKPSQVRMTCDAERGDSDHVMAISSAQQQKADIIALDGETVETQATEAESLTIQPTNGPVSVIIPSGEMFDTAPITHFDPTEIEPTVGVEVSPTDGAVGGNDASSASGSSPEYEFACPGCPKMYQFRRSLTKHIRSHHSTIEQQKPPTIYEDIAANEQLPFACHLCPKHFETAKQLKQHVSFHLKAENPAKKTEQSK